MARILTFQQYLNENARRTGTKTGLYPLGYSGIGLYPDADYLTHSADAILYLTIDKRLYHNGDKAPFSITHLPGHKQYGDHINNGDKAPFSIQHIEGKPVPPKENKMPGKSVTFKNFIKLVTNPETIRPPDSRNLPN
jgi:hypothetical protein